MNYKKWLTATAQYYGVTEESILRRGGKNPARKTFYYLCYKDGINLYRLSEALGKERTSVLGNMYYTETRDKEAEREIRTHVGANTIEHVIDYWLARPESKSKEIVLTSLIAQKQHYYENQ